MQVGHLKLEKGTGSSMIRLLPRCDPVMGGHGSNFSEIDNFSTLMRLSKTINRSDIKISPACFSLNPEQNKVSLQFIDGIVTLRIPEGNSVTLIGKIASGQTGSMALIDIG